MKEVRTEAGSTEIVLKGNFELTVKSGKARRTTEDSDNDNDRSFGSSVEDETEADDGWQAPKGFKLVEGFKDLWVREAPPNFPKPATPSRGPVVEALRTARKSPSPERDPAKASTPAHSHPALLSKNHVALPQLSHGSASPSRAARTTPSPERNLVAAPPTPALCNPSSPSKKLLDFPEPALPSRNSVAPSRIARRTPSPEKDTILALRSPPSPLKKQHDFPEPVLPSRNSAAPSRSARRTPSPEKNLTHPSSSTPSSSTPPAAARFRAYVLYRGSQPGVFASWSQLKKQLARGKDEDNVYKGFYTLEEARDAFFSAKKSGVIQKLTASPPQGLVLTWVVVEGVVPGVHESAYEMLRDGLLWHGGRVFSFASKEEAEEFWESALEDGSYVTFERPGGA
ncbi:hypothetical protein PQX77_004418 [Marasmius sp. AFHP31]|nr:hypothetical protein PQX77_004418 [Marasmius sp. AFHP31]